MVSRFGARSLAALAVLGFVLVGGLPAKGQIKPPVMKITQSKLKNGMRIVLHEDHSSPIVNVQLWYRVGSKDEKRGQSGFAHLFEHIMFKGSKNVGPEEHARYVEDAGGQLNAGTTFDQTLYWETASSNQLERLLWLEAERMKSLAVDEKNMKSETQVVLEEKRLRFDNPPYGKIIEHVFTNAFKGWPYGHIPIGSEADLTAASLADVQAFHSTYYVPDNVVLTLVGDFNSATALKLIAKYFGGIPAGKSPVPRPDVSEPTQTEERRVVAYDPKAPLPALIAVFKTPEYASKDRYALELAGNILSAGESSRMHRGLVYEKQLALAAAGQTFSLEKTGLFFFFSILAPGKQAEEGEKALFAEIDRLVNEPVTAEELAKAKTQIVSRLVRSRTTIQGKADAIAQAAFFTGDPLTVNTDLQRYQAVTAADIQRVSKTYFRPDNRLVVQMLPESMKK